MEKNKEKKKIGDYLYRIIMLILIVIIVVCSVKLGKIFYEYYVGKKAYDSVAELAGVGEGLKFELDWKALEAENDDIVGWLYSKGTVINYPVVQGEDNSFYLTRMFNKEWNGKGTLFVDYRCETPFDDFNTIIYGHRMKDGSMFKSLGEYRDTDGYFDEHKVMTLATKEKLYELQIFSAATIPSDSKLYQYMFYNDAEKSSYINQVVAANEIPGYDESISVTASDRLVMLSTCTYEFENARLVVWGKLVEKEKK